MVTRRPTIGGVGIKTKPLQIRLKLPSKTKRKLREAKARAKVQREARAKRLAAANQSKQERGNATALRRLQRLKREELKKQSAAARRELSRGRANQKRLDKAGSQADRAEYRDRLRKLKESLFGKQKVQRQLENQRQSSEYAKRLRQLNVALFGKEKAAAMRRDEQYARRLRRLNESLFGKPKRKRSPKNLPGTRSKKKLGDRQRPGCNHAPTRERTARGRRAGEKATYTDKQTSRYQSLWLRAQRARLLPAPRKSGGYYLFTPGACRGKSYRVTPSVPTFANLVKTLSDVQEGDLPRVWSYEDLVFRWAVTYPPDDPNSPPGSFPPGPPPPNPPPSPAPPNLPSFAVCGVKYVLLDNQTYVANDLGGISPGLSFRLAESADQFFLCRDESRLPPMPPSTVSYTRYDQDTLIRHEIGTVRFIFATSYITGLPFPPPNFPPLYGVPGSPSPPPSPPGQPGTAGMTWTSKVFPLDEQQDMLLKFAYLVRAAGAGDSYIDVLQNGLPFKRLLLDDYTKGAKQRALPITLLGGATYQFVIRIAPESNIEAAIVRLGGQYVCNCPDYAKLQPAFASRFLSEMRDRNWEGSNAGIKVIGDCKHIMRLKLLLGEPLDPSDPPDLASLRQWLKDRGRAVTEQRKQRRKQQTTARRGIKADLAAARRKDRNERLAPRRANRNAAKLRKLKRLQSKRLNPGIPALNRRDRKAKTAQFNQRLKAAEVKRQEAIVNRHNNPRGSSVIDHLPWMPSVD